MYIYRSQWSNSICAAIKADEPANEESYWTRKQKKLAPDHKNEKSLNFVIHLIWPCFNNGQMNRSWIGKLNRSSTSKTCCGRALFSSRKTLEETVRGQVASDLGRGIVWSRPARFREDVAGVLHTPAHLSHPAIFLHFRRMSSFQYVLGLVGTEVPKIRHQFFSMKNWSPSFFCEIHVYP